jgi:hypothetical protein
MKLLLIKPNYFGGTVISEGNTIETDEQHGRELIKKGFAKLVENDTAALPEPEPAKGKNKKG